ncbi:sensor histidine kinase [Mesorhizobium sp. BE184]|uniref:sensor histidine kinase n=1 Tax=Mesorhizobium sp. BE184 TaxID=2817714 RepID=UPI00285467B3|nr:sensor histidine kinase [Mesorhizobium sp. BE184]MDR7032225.1 Na+/proline symporter/nitrogen-specific signal transduction histidine kinase [Mesorhizobium sp. BE184]
MHQANFVVFVCITYVAILFAVAFAGDSRARKNPAGLLSSPLVYTLSISIYCSSWTFFGSVGSAAKNGLEFLTIYLGPTIVFAGWWLFLRKLVTVGRVHHTTSIADFISARFGKSPVLGALITILALVAITPYIALQLKALTASFQVITYPAGAVVAASRPLEPDFAVAFWLAAGLCLFSIVFGVRNIDVNERHHGVIAAIAVEALVKLVAFMAVGLWVFFVLSRTPDLMFRNAPASLMSPEEGFAARWVALCFLSGAAVICLPRQFQVTVVENSSEEQIRTASWMFPLYLLLINLFVIPIAMAGLNNLPPGSDPDLFVLTLPMTNGGETVGLLAFLGGFSSATSMVIVSSIALSTMISNHIVMPLALRFSLVPTGGGQSARNFILVARRMSIVFTIFLGFTYFWISRTSGALASIGLISFCGLIQPLPSLIAGLYWHRATHRGAIAGLAAGFLIWAYTLFLPSFKGAFLMSADVIANGPFGLNWLNPHALFGLDAFDPLVHALFWSMTVNTALLVIVSLLREPTPLTRFQATLFIDIFRRQTESELGVIRRTARVSELRQIADRILGPVESVSLFDKGDVEPAVIASDELITLVETRLAANVGAASARSLVSRVVTSETISVDELKRLAGEAEQIRAYSAELESKSRQIEATAAELAEANDRLREIDVQKDEFLSQVSHEVRTPMTSIRSFSEILLKNRDLDESRKLHFLGIIQSESFRLTRLLDGILDLNFLEPGTQTWEVTVFDPETAIDQAVETCEPLARAAGVRIKRGRRSRNARVLGSRDRLTQVFINLVSNAIKHNTSANPEVVVTGAAGRKGFYEARVTDNGPGIPLKDRELIFTKFFRGQKARQGGVGLGLPISRQIVERFGGDLSCTSAKTKGAEFVVRLPLRFD